MNSENYKDSCKRFRFFYCFMSESVTNMPSLFIQNQSVYLIHIIEANQVQILIFWKQNFTNHSRVILIFSISLQMVLKPKTKRTLDVCLQQIISAKLYDVLPAFFFNYYFTEINAVFIKTSPISQYIVFSDSFIFKERSNIKSTTKPSRNEGITLAIIVRAFRFFFIPPSKCMGVTWVRTPYPFWRYMGIWWVG